MHLSTKILISIIIFICFSCSKTPESIVKKYLNAKTVEERISCVKPDADVIRLMKKRYDEDYFLDTKEQRYKDFRFKSIEVNPGEFIEFIKLTGYRKSNPDNYEKGIFYLTKDKNNNYLIDWKASKGIADMTVKQLTIQRPRNPTLLYANAELSNYYNYEFSGTQRTNLSIQLSSHESYFDFIVGYARKDSPGGKELYRILEDGDPVPITVKVSFTSYDRGGGVVIIDEFLHEYWGDVILK